MDKLTENALKEINNLLNNMPVTLTSIEINKNFLNQLVYIHEVVNKPDDDNSKFFGIPIHITDEISGCKLNFIDGTSEEYSVEKIEYNYKPIIDNSLYLSKADTDRMYELNKKTFDDFKMNYGWIK